MTIFQTVTLEGWSQLMWMYSDSYNWLITSFFFISCIVVCSVFLLNLTIAFLLQNYSELDRSAGFSFQNDVKLRQKGQKYKIPECILDEILTLDISNISVSKSRRDRILKRYDTKEIRMLNKTFIEQLYESFIWDPSLI